MSGPGDLETLAFGLAAGRGSLYRIGGRLSVGVVVKATFALQHGRAATPVEADAIVTKDRYHERSPTRSVEQPSDVAPYKPRGEVVLHGHAHTPNGVPSASAAVRLAIRGADASIDKTLHVYGDRAAPNEAPAPFQRMPLVYERAIGGEGTDNPVGVSSKGGRQPNVVDPRDPSRPAGFGAISPYWPSRKRHLPSGARRGAEQPIPELAEGFDFEYYLLAPEDQRTAFFRGDEWIVLDGLHPALPRLQTRLPSVRAAARVVRPSRTDDVALALDTLIIDADRLVVTAVWRGILPDVTEAEAGGLRVLAGAVVGDAPFEWPVVAPAAANTPVPAPVRAASGPLESPLEEDPLAGTMMLSADDAIAAIGKSATPFQAGASAPRADEAPRAHGTGGLPFRSADAPPPAMPPPAPAPPAHAPPIPDSPWATGSRSHAPSPSAPSVAPPAPSIPPPPLVPSSSAVAPPAVVAPAMIAPPLVGAPANVPPPPMAMPPAAAPPPVAGAAKADATSRSPSPERTPPKRGRKPGVPIVNPTPLVAVTVPWQLRPPKDSLTIIVKGTFDIVPDGPAELREEGDYPIGDVHVDDDAEKSLVYGSDFAIFKPKADVTLMGTAYAPPTAGGSTTAMQVEFHFGSGSNKFVRRAAILGDRRWQKALLAIAPTPPEPFTTMPLTWERAFGGPSFDANPTGAGHKAHAGPDGVARLPNLEDPGHLVDSPSDSPEPACFAPVSMLWKERWSKLGTYDRRWFKLRWPYFPEDFDLGFHQVAPKPQQLEYLKGDEPFRVVGMRPDTPRLDGRLPGMRARCFVQMTEEAGADFREVPLVLDTAAFDVDAMKLSLVWRAFVEVSDEEAPEIEALFVAAEDLADAPMTLPEAHALYIEAATPKPPEETSPEEEAAPAAADVAPPEPTPAEQVAAARAELMKQLAAAGIPVREVELDAPAEPPPPPDRAAVEKSLREAGVPEEEIREVLEAIADTPDDPGDGAPRVELREKVLELLAKGAPLDELDLAGADLSDLDFSGRSLAGTLLKGASLARCSFEGARLEGAVLARADLTEARLAGADLTNADLAGVEAPRANFTNAILDGTVLDAANLEGAVLEGARGASARLGKARLARADLRGAKLVESDFTAADLAGAVLDGAVLPQVRMYDVTGRGASFQKVEMPGARLEAADFAQADFTDVKAPGSVWEYALLNEAKLARAVLTGASFARATCLKTVFAMADLTEGRFRRAKLGGAVFLRANLMMATFERADLTLADFRGANLHAAETWKAKLEHAQLEQAIVTKSKLA